MSAEQKTSHLERRLFFDFISLKKFELHGDVPSSFGFASLVGLKFDEKVLLHLQHSLFNGLMDKLRTASPESSIAFLQCLPLMDDLEVLRRD